MNILVQEDLNAIVAEACAAAQKACSKFFIEKMNGQDQMCCGFAWVEILGVKGNTKLGKMLKKAGLKQDYNKAFTIWNPGDYAGQNIDCKEEGARAAADVFRKYGFKSYANSRLD